MCRIVVAGGRHFSDYNLLSDSCNSVIQRHKLTEIEIVSGCARGADSLGERYAIENKYNIKRFPANWSLGKSAGFIRNKEMAEYSDILIAFWDGNSKGTNHMINLARSNNLVVHVFRY